MARRTTSDCRFQFSVLSCPDSGALVLSRKESLGCACLPRAGEASCKEGTGFRVSPLSTSAAQKLQMDQPDATFPVRRSPGHALQ